MSREVAAPERHDGQAAAVDGDAVADLRALQNGASLECDIRAEGNRSHRAHRSDFLN